MNWIWPLLGLCFSAFTSATILPGTSEAAFVAFIGTYPQKWGWALMCASLFNGAGGMVSYIMGRWVPQKNKRPSEKIERAVQRWGVWLLLLSWVPVIGDAFALAAGWLRLNIWLSALALFMGKWLRYLFLLAAVKAWW